MENGLVRDAIMNFSTETRVNEIALSNPSARRVLEDAGVDYCCGGGKSLQGACLHAGVTTDEILKRLRQNRELVGPGDTEWATAPTRYLRVLPAPCFGGVASEFHRSSHRHVSRRPAAIYRHHSSSPHPRPRERAVRLDWKEQFH